MAASGSVGPRNYADNVLPSDGSRYGNQGQLITSDLHGRYYEQAARGNIFTAHAIVTAPVIYTTAAGTGGPLLWNGSSTVKASILAVGWGQSTVTTVAAVIGLTGNSGQTSAPTATTAVDSVKCTLIGGGSPACTAYRVGTTASAGNFFHPLGDVKTGALTTEPGSMNWVDIGGMFVVPQFGWISFAASATASTTVGNFVIVWEEVSV